MIWLVSKAWFRIHIEGEGRLPPSGSYVVAPGAHRSNLDTLVISLITTRRMRYMGKDSLWKKAWADWFLSALGGFPVNREGADREALRLCREIVEFGEPVVMFPEGTRQSGPEITEMHDGPVYVASRTGVPVVPVGIGGSEAAMPVGSKLVYPRKMTIIVGDPMDPPSPKESGRVSRSAVRSGTEELTERLQELFDRAQEQAGAPNPPRASR